jgi:hypothetical protein
MSNHSNIDPYERLANEIILQAVKDYRGANKKLAKGRKNSAAEYVKNECIRFFRSPFFGVLTNIDPEMLIQELEEETR